MNIELSNFPMTIKVRWNLRGRDCLCESGQQVKCVIQNRNCDKLSFLEDGFLAKAGYNGKRIEVEILTR